MISIPSAPRISTLQSHKSMPTTSTTASASNHGGSDSMPLATTLRRSSTEFNKKKKYHFHSHASRCVRLSDTTSARDMALSIVQAQYYIYHTDLSGYLAGGAMVQEVLSKYALGASAKDLYQIHSRFRPDKERIPPLPTIHITTSNWRDWLGHKNHYHDYLEFFDQELRRVESPTTTETNCCTASSINSDESTPTGSALAKFAANYLSFLIPGLCSATSPLVHIGFGLEFGSRLALAEGLAYACISFMPTATRLILSQSSEPQWSVDQCGPQYEYCQSLLAPLPQASLNTAAQLFGNNADHDSTSPTSPTSPVFPTDCNPSDDCSSLGTCLIGMAVLPNQSLPKPKVRQSRQNRSSCASVAILNMVRNDTRLDGMFDATRAGKMNMVMNSRVSLLKSYLTMWSSRVGSTDEALLDLCEIGSMLLFTTQSRFSNHSQQALGVQKLDTNLANVLLATHASRFMLDILPPGLDQEQLLKTIWMNMVVTYIVQGRPVIASVAAPASIAPSKALSTTTTTTATTPTAMSLTTVVPTAAKAKVDHCSGNAGQSGCCSLTALFVDDSQCELSDHDDTTSSLRNDSVPGSNSNEQQTSGEEDRWTVLFKDAIHTECQIVSQLVRSLWWSEQEHGKVCNDLFFTSAQRAIGVDPISDVE